MLYLCVRGVIDIVFSVCIATRGDVGARVWVNCVLYFYTYNFSIMVSIKLNHIKFGNQFINSNNINMCSACTISYLIIYHLADCHHSPHDIQAEQYNQISTVYTRVIVEFLSPKYSFILGGSTFTRGTFLAI